MTTRMSAGRPSARTGAPGKTLEDLKEPTTRINGEIPRELHRRVKIQAAHEGTTMVEIMVKALNEYLSKSVK
jgi:predicted HicB family RNase H-like nuclease